MSYLKITKTHTRQSFMGRFVESVLRMAVPHLFESFHVQVGVQSECTQPRLQKCTQNLRLLVVWFALRDYVTGVFTSCVDGARGERTFCTFRGDTRNWRNNFFVAVVVVAVVVVAFHREIRRYVSIFCLLFFLVGIFDDWKLRGGCGTSVVHHQRSYMELRRRFRGSPMNRVS